MTLWRQMNLFSPFLHPLESVLLAFLCRQSASVAAPSSASALVATCSFVWDAFPFFMQLNIGMPVVIFFRSVSLPERYFKKNGKAWHQTGQCNALPFVSAFGQHEYYQMHETVLGLVRLEPSRTIMQQLPDRTMRNHDSHNNHNIYNRLQ
jgi:hypothetical protein